jgi:uncharacterized membrane protein YiaA
VALKDQEHQEYLEVSRVVGRLLLLVGLVAYLIGGIRLRGAKGKVSAMKAYGGVDV